MSFFLKKNITIEFPIPIKNLEEFSLFHLIIYDLLIFKFLSAWVLFYRINQTKKNFGWSTLKILNLTVIIRLLGYSVFFLLNILRIIDFIIVCITHSNLKNKNVFYWPFIIFYHFRIHYFIWIKIKNKNLFSLFECINVQISNGRVNFNTK